MLQRIYGTAFSTKEELQAYLDRLEEAKKRDHRKLGRELDLFDIRDEGPGFPFFYPKGMILRNILEDYWREIHRKAGYEEIKTPIMLNRGLWERSGHWDHYKENMYTTKIDDTDFAIKPMNCPGGILEMCIRDRYCVVNNAAKPQSTTVYRGDSSSFSLDLAPGGIQWFEMA